MRSFLSMFARHWNACWLTLIVFLIANEIAFAAQPKKPGKAVSSRAPTTWVPEDAMVLVVARPSEMVGQASLRPIIELLSADFVDRVGVSLAEIDTLTLVSDPHMRPSFVFGPFGCIIRSAEKPLVVNPKLKEQSEEITVDDASFLVNNSTGLAYFTPGDNTMIVGSRFFVETAIWNGRQSKSSLLSGTAWDDIAGSPIAIDVSGPALPQLIPRADELLAAFNPILQSTKRICLGLQMEDKTRLLAYVEPTDASSLPAIKDTVQAAVILASNTVQYWSARIPPAVTGGALLAPASDLLKSVQIDTHEGRVRLRASLDDDGKLLALVARQVEAARTDAQRILSVNNLRQIALAMHNHHDVFKRFPPASGVRKRRVASENNPDEKKDFPCSWRVRILPFVEQAVLYDSYRFDEPWDSENNKKILTKMPPIFRHPLDDLQSTNTSYFVLTGPTTPFANDHGMNFKDIVDGSSNTLMIVEAKRAVPWTKPEDIEYDADKPIPELGGWSAAGFNAAFCDGSVRFIHKNVDQQTLRPFFTRAGREPQTPAQLQPPAAE